MLAKATVTDMKFKFYPWIHLILLEISLLTVFLTYSFQPEELQMAGISLKKISTKWSQPPARTSVSIFDNLQLNKIIDTFAIKRYIIKNQVDTTRQRILVTGDSMSDGINWWMKYYCKYNKHILKGAAWPNSSTPAWAGTDTLEKLVKNFKPTYILLCLGSNELFIRNVQSREPLIKKIISQADTIPFVWIGPPNWKKDSGINDIIEMHCGKGRYFPSKELTLPRGPDGAHPTLAGYRIWTDSLAYWLENHAAKRIRLTKFPNNFKI